MLNCHCWVLPGLFPVMCHQDFQLCNLVHALQHLLVCGDLGDHGRAEAGLTVVPQVVEILVNSAGVLETIIAVAAVGVIVITILGVIAISALGCHAPHFIPVTSYLISVTGN